MAYEWGSLQPIIHKEELLQWPYQKSKCFSFFFFFWKNTETSLVMTEPYYQEFIYEFFSLAFITVWFKNKKNNKKSKIGKSRS